MNDTQPQTLADYDAVLWEIENTLAEGRGSMDAPTYLQFTRLRYNFRNYFRSLMNMTNKNDATTMLQFKQINQHIIASYKIGTPTSQIKSLSTAISLTKMMNGIGHVNTIYR